MSSLNWLERCVLAHPYLVLCLDEKAFLRAYRYIFEDAATSPPVPSWISRVGP